MHCKISDKNSKLGKIPNVSLPPVISCRPDAPCVKDCYAMKAWRMYPNVKKAWSHNLEAYKNHTTEYFSSIVDYLEKKRRKPVTFFRWHVSGDIVDDVYLYEMCGIALLFPDVTFLAFTKQYEIVNNYPYDIPENLTIVFSAWPGLDMDNPHGYRVAWFDDGTDDRIPTETLECPGLCEACGMCFNINKIGMDVCFKKH